MKKQFLFLAILLFPFFLSAQESYYSDVNLNLTGIPLKNALITKITNTHTNFLTYTPDVWEASRITDLNPSNSNQVLLIYGWENGTDGDITNDRTRDKNNNGGSTGQWNREHVYPRSLGNPNLGSEGPGADAHSLRPSDVQRNSSRGNKPFATGSGNSGAVTNGWYPGDEWKGDVARMMMYMYLRYGTRCLPSVVGVGSNASTPDDMIDLFLQWNVDDPVSDFEKQRNTYHENTNNTYAQGNRNPFIDNPYLATRIWGGPEAEDVWGIYTGADTEAPTVPTNVMASNITTSSITISWTASTDNEGVSSYEVYRDGNLENETSNTSYDVTGLTPNTNYSFTVLAKDLAGNESALSSPVNTSTLEDTQAPSIPSNVTISNETTSSFKITWTASTDNTGIANYEVYLDNQLEGTTLFPTYTASGLNSDTTYSVTIIAVDVVNNKSNASSPVNASTSGSGTGGNATDLFFSEYIEGSSGFNKALEIFNSTGGTVDLSAYSIKRQRNGGADGNGWGTALVLSGNLVNNEVYVIVNSSASIQKLLDEADLLHTGASQGEPINFNGDDPVGLFKNDVLIDIIGVFDGGDVDFAKDVTLRRKFSVTQPNTTFDKANEWDEFSGDAVDNFGVHSSILSNDTFTLNSIQLYPNPVNQFLYFRGIDTDVNLTIFSVLGSKVYSKKVNSLTKQIDVSELKSGIYIIKLSDGRKSITKKFVKSN